LAAALGAKITPLPPYIAVTADEVTAIQDRFSFPRTSTARPLLFGLNAGAEYGPAKRWPYFAELAARFEKPVVLLGSQNDVAAAEGVGGRNLVGRTTLDEAIDIIAGAELVVSNDSGLMHVAAALGRPLVALFGSSSPEKTPPTPGRTRVLWLKPECSPCYQRECPLGHFRCMRELDVDTVLAAAAELR
jgi:heptosyltransferase-2